MPAPHTWKPTGNGIDKLKPLHTYLGGVITEYPNVFTEIARRSSACWMRIRRSQQELYDWPNVPLDIKIRMVKAEAV